MSFLFYVKRSKFPYHYCSKQWKIQKDTLSSTKDSHTHKDILKNEVIKKKKKKNFFENTFQELLFQFYFRFNEEN